MDDRPFFIVGVPRSGTTLLAVMLNRHSKIHVGASAYGHQLALLPSTLRRTFPRSKNYSKFDFEAHLSQALELTPRLKNAISLDTTQNLPERLTTSLQQIANDNGKRVFGDKCPPVIDFLDKLSFVLPNARFVNVVRDGRSVALSHSLRQYTNPLLAMNEWKKSILRSEVSKQFIGESNFMTVRFEDLIEQPESTLANICKFLGQEYEQGLSCEASAEPKRASNSYVKPEIDKNKVKTWADLAPKTLKAMEAIAGDVLECNGYDLVSSVDKSNIAVLSRWKEMRLELSDAIAAFFRVNVVVMRDRKLVQERRSLRIRLRALVSCVVNFFVGSKAKGLVIKKNDLF